MGCRARCRPPPLGLHRNSARRECRRTTESTAAIGRPRRRGSRSAHFSFGWRLASAVPVFVWLCCWFVWVVCWCFCLCVFWISPVVILQPDGTGRRVLFVFFL